MAINFPSNDSSSFLSGSYPSSSQSELGKREQVSSIESKPKYPKLQKPRVTWGKYNTLKVIKRGSGKSCQIKGDIPLRAIFTEREFKGVESTPVTTFSRDPIHVKEIQDYRENKKNMSDERILKNYNRLKKKLEHIFTPQRSYSFQEEVMDYLSKYEKLMRSREIQIAIDDK